MRIAHICATFPPYWGGTGNVCYYNAVELAHRGYEVHVFTAQYESDGYRDPEEIIVHRLWTPFRIGNAPLTPTLITTIRNFDLVHLHWPFIFGAELTWLSLLHSRTPYVMTYHLDLKSENKWIFGPYQKFWGPILTRYARKVIAVTAEHIKSSQIYSILHNRLQDIIIVPNGVDITKFTPNLQGSSLRSQKNIPNDAVVIIFVGAMDKAHEYKGVPDLINAFTLLNSPKAWLLIVGGGDLLPMYMALTNKLPIQSRNRVIFTGSIPHNLLPLYYSAADLCVLPSRQPESFGIVLIEAMSCGIPVIASDSPGVRSIVNDGEDGLLVRPRDTADLVEKIRLLLFNPTQRAEMGYRGRKKVEASYSWPIVVERLENVYSTILLDQAHGGYL